jgi:multidrug resistance efflux pump
MTTTNNNNNTTLTIPNNAISIGDYAFAANQLTSVVIPDSVTKIGSRAFAENPLCSVIIGEGVDIAPDAFPGNFHAIYDSYFGRAAGLYVYRDGRWLQDVVWWLEHA